MEDLAAEAGLITVQMCDTRVASKTVGKDKGRCYYCKEIGHFVSKCTKKIEDERGQARYNSMGQGISQFEDWEVLEWDDDYVGGIEHLNN